MSPKPRSRVNSLNDNDAIKVEESGVEVPGMGVIKVPIFKGEVDVPILKGNFSELPLQVQQFIAKYVSLPHKLFAFIKLIKNKLFLLGIFLLYHQSYM